MDHSAINPSAQLLLGQVPSYPAPLPESLLGGLVLIFRVLDLLVMRIDHVIDLSVIQ